MELGTQSALVGGIIGGGVATLFVFLRAIVTRQRNRDDDKRDK